MQGVGLIGFGRVGRGVVRELHRRGSIERVRLMSEVAPKGRDLDQHTIDLAYLLAHDSSYGLMPAKVEASGRNIIVDGHRIAVSYERRASLVPWDLFSADVLVEATGEPAVLADARTLLKQGVKRVLLNGFSPDSQITLVKGVNWDEYDPGCHRLIGCSTCTANALAPVLKVLWDKYGLDRVAVTSVHPALSGDTLLDSPHPQAPAGRSGLTVRVVSSGVPKSVSQLLPQLTNKITALSLRVPTATVNALVVDLDLTRPPRNKAEVLAFLEARSQGGLRGVLRLDQGFYGRCKTAHDFAGDPHSAVIDTNWIELNAGSLRLLIWHDNEYAYCCRVVDLLERLAAVDCPTKTEESPRPEKRLVRLADGRWGADSANQVQMDAASAIAAGR